jgi:transcriptional regulator with XRE-family HTH domain
MDNEYLQKFANNLKKLRNEKGLSQEDLAVSDNISRSMISLIETVKTDLTVSKVKIIADTLNVHPKELFDFD